MPYLLNDKAPLKLLTGLGLVGPDAADKVGLGVDQRPQQVVQPGVEVLDYKDKYDRESIKLYDEYIYLSNCIFIYIYFFYPTSFGNKSWNIKTNIIKYIHLSV